jgi:hypothetical protein
VTVGALAVEPRQLTGFVFEIRNRFGIEGDGDITRKHEWVHEPAGDAPVSGIHRRENGRVLELRIPTGIRRDAEPVIEALPPEPRGYHDNVRMHRLTRTIVGGDLHLDDSTQRWLEGA